MYDARSDADPAHRTLKIADVNGIANVYRPLKKKNQARNEIIHNALQAEADADAKSAREDAHLGKINAQDSEAGDEAEGENNIVEQTRNCIGKPWSEIDSRVNILL